MVKADTIIENTMKFFYEGQDNITKYFEKFTAKINLTTDIWTSPNGKAILAITAHWVDNNFVLRELILDAIELKGKHTGVNIANHVVATLKRFDLENKIFCMTTDNASNNKTMAEELGKHLNGFIPRQHLLGCVGDVINLAAQAGLKSLGAHSTELIVDENFDYEIEELIADKPEGKLS